MERRSSLRRQNGITFLKTAEPPREVTPCTWYYEPSNPSSDTLSSNIAPSCTLRTSLASAYLFFCIQSTYRLLDHDRRFPGMKPQTAVTVRSWSRTVQIWPITPLWTWFEHLSLYHSCITGPFPSPPQAESSPGTCTRNYCCVSTRSGIARRRPVIAASTPAFRLRIPRR